MDLEAITITRPQLVLTGVTGPRQEPLERDFPPNVDANASGQKADIKQRPFDLRWSSEMDTHRHDDDVCQVPHKRNRAYLRHRLALYSWSQKPGEVQ